MRKLMHSNDRPEGYRYFKIVSDHLGHDLSKVFNGKLVYPRQVEIHLPGDHKRACNFNCYYCQGRLLEQPLASYEEDALRIVDELEGKVPYFIYGGAYTEPLLNPYLLDFLRLTKKHGSYFGIHTNGSLLLNLERKQSLLSELGRLATSKQDYLSISLDAGTPASHMQTKNVKRNWFDEILKGLALIARIRGNSSSPALRVCYLLNRFNSSLEEIHKVIKTMRDIKVDSLRFSIPYDLYGKDFDTVRRYKSHVEVKQDELYVRILEPLMSRTLDERPYIFYLPPVTQDVDRMNYRQCIYSYYQITMAADGYVYRCSSTASPSFKFARLGKIPKNQVEFNQMIVANHDPNYKCSTCFKAGARCNRIALEINTVWSKRSGN